MAEYVYEYFATFSENFHFLRPDWFYALIPAALVFSLLRYRQSHHSNWERAIDPHLLPHILDNPDKVVSKSPLTLIFIAWLLATVALAGPVWRQTPQPVHEREDALVVIFDLTRSMLATDVKPDRLVRAKRKLIDLLEMRDEGVTALIVFAGDAHVVSPLTDDTKTIAAMIPALSPDIVPAPGSQLTPALERAIDLFHDGGVTSGRILIITDEIRDVVAAQGVARQYRNAYPISVLSVGTADGAPVAMVSGRPDLGYLKDSSGNLVIPRLDAGSLQDFAQLAGGRYSPMTLTDEDLAYLLAEQPLLEDTRFRELERDFDVWFEEGPWLLLLLLPLASLAFRRGWLWSIALLVITLPAPNQAQASLWDDLWQTRDQQALDAYKAGDSETAAELFENPAWKATANYRGENFEDAANQFGGIGSSDGQYNLGNALAKQGLFNEAIEAYDKALAMNPQNEDAQFNKELIEKLLEQQEQQQQQNQDQNQEQQDDSDDSERQQDDQQSQDEQSEQEQQEQSQNSEQEQNDEQAEQQEQEGQDKEQKEQPQQPNEQQASMEEDADPLDEEEQQALQQWLRRVPDDPGGLLRRKFQQQHEERVKQGEVTRSDAAADW